MIVMFKFSKLGSKNYKIFSVSRTSFHLTSFWLAAGAPGLTATRRWKCRSCRRRGRWLPGCRLLDCYIITPNARSVPDGGCGWGVEPPWVLGATFLQHFQHSKTRFLQWVGSGTVGRQPHGNRAPVPGWWRLISWVVKFIATTVDIYTNIYTRIEENRAKYISPERVKLNLFHIRVIFLVHTEPRTQNNVR